MQQTRAYFYYAAKSGELQLDAQIAILQQFYLSGKYWENPSPSQRIDLGSPWPLTLSLTLTTLGKNVHCNIDDFCTTLKASSPKSSYLSLPLE